VTDALRIAYGGFEGGDVGRERGVGSGWGCYGCGYGGGYGGDYGGDCWVSIMGEMCGGGGRVRVNLDMNSGKHLETRGGVMGKARVVSAVDEIAFRDVGMIVYLVFIYAFAILVEVSTTIVPWAYCMWDDIVGQHT